MQCRWRIAWPAPTRGVFIEQSGALRFLLRASGSESYHRFRSNLLQYPSTVASRATVCSLQENTRIGQLPDIHKSTSPTPTAQAVSGTAVLGKSRLLHKRLLAQEKMTTCYATNDVFKWVTWNVYNRVCAFSASKRMTNTRGSTSSMFSATHVAQGSGWIMIVHSAAANNL